MEALKQSNGNGKDESLVPVRFHFYSLKFTPYKEHTADHSSSSILKNVLTYLMTEAHAGRGHLIDRNSSRSQEGPRELFATGAVFMHKEMRLRCSLALLRKGQYRLIPLHEMDASIAEQTHFFVDYSRNIPVMCVEFNHHGPRIPDIEYYIRSVAKDKLQLAKSVEFVMHMDSKLDEALAKFKNALNIEIKMNPQKLSEVDTELVGKYFTGMSTLHQKLRPQFIKLEALFQTPGRPIRSEEISQSANSMVKDMMAFFKRKPYAVDCFENFVVKYEDKEGMEDTFNLLKGKREIIKEIEPKMMSKRREVYEMIEGDFDEFMKTLP
jgi:hypothetical protein